MRYKLYFPSKQYNSLYLKSLEAVKCLMRHLFISNVTSHSQENKSVKNTSCLISSNPTLEPCAPSSTNVFARWFHANPRKYCNKNCTHFRVQLSTVKCSTNSKSEATFSAVVLAFSTVLRCSNFQDISFLQILTEIVHFFAQNGSRCWLNYKNLDFERQLH